MAIPIKPKRTFTANKVPTTADLQDGEMGINVPDGRIYVRQGSTVQLVGSKEQGSIKSVIADTGAFNGLRLYANTSGDQVSIGIDEPTSLPTNYFLSTPQIVGGTHTFRAITASDLPSLDASKITEGTFPYARLPYPQDFIEGLTISTGDTSITVSSGSAYVPSTGAVIASGGATISSSRAANTTYNLYITATGSISRLSTAPVSYYKTARIAGTQTNMRYIGSVRTDASGRYIRQITYSGQNCVEVLFLNNTTTNVIHNGTAPSTPVDVSADGYAPITANRLKCRIQTNNNNAGADRIYAWDGSSFVIWSNTALGLVQYTLDIPCDSTPKFQFDSTGATRNPFVMLLGYYYDR